MKARGATKTAGLLGTMLTIGALTAAQADTLTLNGKTASSDVRMVGGSPYVKLSDVAKALGMVVVRRAGGYELTKAGGANQVNGDVQGKMGDTLFDGRWRFTVLGMITADSLTFKSQGEPSDDGGATKYNSVTRTFTPSSGNRLVILTCRISNGQKTAQTFWMAHGDSNTALTDTDGQSYPPTAYDVNGAPIQTKVILPGAKVEFPLIFSIPTGAKVKDLVFTLRNNNSSEKGHDVRVSLAGQ